MKSHPDINSPASMPRVSPKGEKPRNHRTGITDETGTLEKSRLSRLWWDVVGLAEWWAIFKYLKSFYIYTVSSEKSPLETQSWESSSCKWQFILSEPKRVLEKQWKGIIRGSGYRWWPWPNSLANRGQRTWSLHRRYGGSHLVADLFQRKEDYAHN